MISRVLLLFDIREPARGWVFLRQGSIVDLPQRRSSLGLAKNVDSARAGTAKRQDDVFFDLADVPRRSTFLPLRDDPLS